MSRPVIKLLATKIDERQVFAQFSNSLRYFGGLTMPLKDYEALRNSLMTGSLNSGDSGAEVSLAEDKFDVF